MILTLDFGTSNIKAVLWGPDGLVAMAAAPLATAHPAPGWSEQRPADWWYSLVESCARLAEEAPAALADVDAVACTGARQTMVPVDRDGGPIGPAIVWSDRRAALERQASGSHGPAEPGRHDSPPAGGGPRLGDRWAAATVAWLDAHDPGRLAASAWLLAPRDLVVWWLTGTVATDPTMASRSGLYDDQGRVASEVSRTLAGKLAPVVPSDTVTGTLGGPAAEALGLRAGVPVITGAGDRACEVLGAGASEIRPMVSWGTTANASLPVVARPEQVPAGLVMSAGATDGWLLEGGLSAAGSLLSWFGGLTGNTPGEVAALAGASPAGARGVVATPWLEGARAPWWRVDARAALMGMTSAHEPADLARALVESVARDLQRCVEVMALRRPEGPTVSGLTLGGAGASDPVWAEVLGGTTGLAVTARRSGQAASAGAALLAARAMGTPWDLDRLDPVTTSLLPDAAMVNVYAGLRARDDAVASSVLGLAAPSEGGLPCG